MLSSAHLSIMTGTLWRPCPGLVCNPDLCPSHVPKLCVLSLQEKNFRFGVREHAMGAICNGIALHNKGFVPYCATFFIFTDYMRASIRMAALSEVRIDTTQHPPDVCTLLALCVEKMGEF